MMPSVPTITSRAGKLASAAMPMRQSQPSGSTAGSIHLADLAKNALFFPVDAQLVDFLLDFLDLLNFIFSVVEIVAFVFFAMIFDFIFQFGDLPFKVAAGKIQGRPDEHHAREDDGARALEKHPAGVHGAAYDRLAATASCKAASP